MSHREELHVCPQTSPSALLCACWPSAATSYDAGRHPVQPLRAERAQKPDSGPHPAHVKEHEASRFTAPREHHLRASPSPRRAVD